MASTVGGLGRRGELPPRRPLCEPLEHASTPAVCRNAGRSTLERTHAYLTLANGLPRFWRAITASESETMRTRISSNTLAYSAVEEFEARFEVQSRLDGIEAKTELAHGHSHLRPDSHDHHLGAPEAVRERHGAQRARHE